jgi:hypothetical protein
MFLLKPFVLRMRGGLYWLKFDGIQTEIDGFSKNVRFFFLKMKFSFLSIPVSWYVTKFYNGANKILEKSAKKMSENYSKKTAD